MRACAVQCSMQTTVHQTERCFGLDVAPQPAPTTTHHMVSQKCQATDHCQSKRCPYFIRYLSYSGSLQINHHVLRWKNMDISDDHYSHQIFSSLPTTNIIQWYDMNISQRQIWNITNILYDVKHEKSVIISDNDEHHPSLLCSHFGAIYKCLNLLN